MSKVIDFRVDEDVKEAFSGVFREIPSSGLMLTYCKCVFVGCALCKQQFCWRDIIWKSTMATLAGFHDAVKMYIYQPQVYIYFLITPNRLVRGYTIIISQKIYYHTISLKSSKL